jgi:hypothetical protein
MVIILQVINLYSAFLETGTQGSIDGYIFSVFFGLLLTILVVFFERTHNKIESKLFLFCVLSQTLILLVLHSSFIYYVVLQHYRINDVLTDVIKLGIAKKGNDYYESFLVIIMYLHIFVLGMISIKGISKKTNNK